MDIYEIDGDEILADSFHEAAIKFVRSNDAAPISLTVRHVNSNKSVTVTVSITRTETYSAELEGVVRSYVFAD